MKTLLSYILIFLAFSAISLESSDVKDTRGRDFWIAFMPNYHNYQDSEDSLKRHDELFIFVASDSATTGEIEYYDIYQNSYVHEFSIPEGGGIHEFSINYENFELEGFNNHESTLQNRQNEQIAPQTFHITTDRNVAVFAHNQAQTTSDATLVFPTDVLGDEYIVLTYNSDGSESRISGNGWNTLDGRTPSQFVIIATEDNTNVTIDPSTLTAVNRDDVQNIKLDRGQCYLVQARITSTYENEDLSGTIINSDKPIAVFAGHQRATIPYNLEDISRDMLVEQMIPTENWGRNAIITPFRQPEGIISHETNDIFRVIASSDNTDIIVNGFKMATINRGEVYQEELTEPVRIEASAPIMVAQYKKTGKFNNITRNGDPFMVIVPPVEQYIDNYRFMPINAKQWRRISEWEEFYYILEDSYIEHKATIIATQEGFNSMTIDDKLIDISLYVLNPIPESDYFYLYLTFNGYKKIESDLPFGLIVYGYGYANSYGYIGGMQFKKIDVKNPQILTDAAECFKKNGSIYDTTEYDSGISIVRLNDNKSENVLLDVDDFTPYADSTKFSVSLDNNYNDGIATIEAIDSIGIKSVEEIEIPGFTVGFRQSKEFDDPLIINEYINIVLHGNYTFTIDLLNYGNFPQTIKNMYFVNHNDLFTIGINPPFEIQPNEELSRLSITFDPLEKGTYSDTLVIESECTDRKIVYIDIHVTDDEKPPEYVSNIDDCNEYYWIEIYDSLDTDSGIETLEIRKKENLYAAVIKNSDDIIMLEFVVQDTRQDAIYEVFCEDKRGNNVTIIDTIPGFTVELLSVEEENVIDIGEHEIGSLHCESLQIINYGSFPITLVDVKLSDKIYYSIPLAQLPFTLEPGEIRSFDVCFSAPVARDSVYRDKLEFVYNCDTTKIIYEGIALPLEKSSNTKCDVPINIKISEISNGYYLSNPWPNPASNSLSIAYGNSKKSDMNISIKNIFGQIVKEYKFNSKNTGDHILEIDSRNIPSGTYFIELSTDSDILFKPLLISK